MAKGWKTILTNTSDTKAEPKAIAVKKARYADTLMRSTKKKDQEALKKEGEDLFHKSNFEKDHLIDAFDNKRVKNKDAIKRAIRIKKERAAVEAKKKDAKQKSKTTSNKEVTDSNEQKG